MKRSLKKLLYILLVVSLILTAVPVLAEAQSIGMGWDLMQTYAQVTVPGFRDADQQVRLTQTLRRPAGFRLLASEEYATDLVAPATQLREGMKQRQPVVTVKYAVTGTFSYDQLALDLLEAAMVHTGEPTEGDYLRWQRGRVNFSFSGYADATTTYLDITCYLNYYTTAEQEAMTDAAVDRLLSDLNLSGKPDYEKLCAVYDWMTANICYDYDHLDDDAYELKYTAYAALMDRTAVCQGYAVLLYRLMLEQGIDCRVITGDSGGRHAWNIVELDGLYYNLDATWDAIYHQAGLEYNYFLCCDATFAEHTRDAQYATNEFNAAYPMAAANYTPPVVTLIASGTCGENVTWTLNDEGILTISGTGPMEDFSCDSVLGCTIPWYKNRGNIRLVVIEEGVTSIGEYAFAECFSLSSITVGSSITDIGNCAFYCCSDLRDIWFVGDAPSFGCDTFYAVYATCYYPGNNETWTADVLQSYGGTVTWQATCMDGHDYQVAITDPTCTEWGVEEITCSRCDYSESRDLAPTGHAYDATVTEPTCIENGYTTHTCGNCGASYTSDRVEALGHSYESAATAPTCTEQGYTTHTCVNCGHSYVDAYTDALGHTWDQGMVTQEPTVEAEGEKTYTCTVCGATHTESIPKKEPVIYDLPEDGSVEIPQNNCFEGGTTVTVEKVEAGEIFQQAADAMENRAETYTVFAFAAVENAVQVQPSGRLPVTFHIPVGYSNNVSVYYMDATGKLTKLEVMMEASARTVTVELEHLGTCILADEDTAPSVLPGDVNGDGRINARDARALLRYIAGLTEEGEVDENAADFNGDDRINARDARAVLRHIAGLE